MFAYVDVFACVEMYVCECKVCGNSLCVLEIGQMGPHPPEVMAGGVSRAVHSA